MKRAKRGWDLGTQADKEWNGKGGALKKGWRARQEKKDWGVEGANCIKTQPIKSDLLRQKISSQYLRICINQIKPSFIL